MLRVGSNSSDTKRAPWAGQLVCCLESTILTFTNTIRHTTTTLALIFPVCKSNKHVQKQPILCQNGYHYSEITAQRKLAPDSSQCHTLSATTLNSHTLATAMCSPNKTELVCHVCSFSKVRDGRRRVHELEVPQRQKASLPQQHQHPRVVVHVHGIPEQICLCVASHLALSLSSLI